MTVRLICVHNKSTGAAQVLCLGLQGASHFILESCSGNCGYQNLFFCLELKPDHMYLGSSGLGACRGDADIGVVGMGVAFEIIGQQIAPDGRKEM